MESVFFFFLFLFIDLHFSNYLKSYQYFEHRQVLRGKQTKAWFSEKRDCFSE